MRSNNSRTPATDFVQDYAAKRQAQMDRARQLREERLQQQQQQSPSGCDAGSNTNNAVPARASPTGSPNSAAARPSPHAQGATRPSSGHAGANASTAESSTDGRVLYVKEADFKQATQAGIITPDQARQLWAMLSNQIIRVCPPSGHSNNAVSVSSLMALSNNSSASSSAGRKSVNGAGSNGNSFGASISLESLRTSIAFFKREQQRLRQQQQQQPGGGMSNGGISGGGPAVGGRPSSSSKAHSRAAYGAPQSQQQRYAYDEDDDADLNEESDHYEGDEHARGVAVPPLRGSPGGGKHSNNRPAWNSDVDIDYADKAPTTSSSSSGAAARKKPRTSVAGKASAARPAFASQQARGGGGGGGGGGRRTGYDEENNSESAYVSSHAPCQPASFLAGTARSRNTAAAAGGRRPPAIRTAVTGGGGVPLNVDDMPVGGGSGGGGMSDWANAYPPGAAPPDSRGGVAGGLSIPSAPENEAIMEEAAAAAREPTTECSTCGRTFRVSVLPRHEALCRKQASKPRKVFNMRDQRLDGVEGITEVQRVAPRNAGARGGVGGRGVGSGEEATKGKLPKWKVQHEQFQAAMRAVRQQNAGGGGFGNGALAPPPAPIPEEYDDRVPCPHCGRKFAEDVAARHIPKCATTVAKPKGIRPIRR
ncbi:hypothetical protein ABL78_7105 [Leptomonas seymouri]|uniref:C2HC/C3H-type domain-containing protein n=1 Tax=Leptomonas seymouri TaxID=5684 RepID=A0A0N1II98_LEPSE|nr:hypothetical protein ABL78_7105 [Leptomonas seymouri]|eukprot:KPI83855.1 hypothetical protein ABL78_7105 [Leptomonas seymouri]